MTDMQRALLRAGVIDKEKINKYNHKKYLKRKKAEKKNGRQQH